ncbi:MAG TPA: VWA domain-containing protein [Cytophagaceae bacterium]|jgi:Ca-activated chloride channel family protein
MKNLEWYSLSWFSPKTLLNFEWAAPFYLYLLPGILLLFILRSIFNLRGKQKLDFALLSNDLKGLGSLSSLRFIPTLFQVLFLTLILVSLARPQKSLQSVHESTEGIDIALVVDISESMLLEDFKPNRLEASKKIISEFLDARPHDRISLVVFAGQAYSLAPLTTDHDLLKKYVSEISFNMLDTGSTSIGNALVVGLNRLKNSTSKSKILILFTDGDNTSGNIGPQTAARLSYAFGVKIYTIGIGTSGKIRYGKDELGEPRYVESSLNSTLLKSIATTTKGEYFRATNSATLKQILNKIGKLEKGEIVVATFNDTQDLYTIYLRWAFVFFLLWMFTKNTFLTNATED